MVQRSCDNSDGDGYLRVEPERCWVFLWEVGWGTTVSEAGRRTKRWANSRLQTKAVVVLNAVLSGLQKALKLKTGVVPSWILHVR